MKTRLIAIATLALLLGACGGRYHQQMRNAQPAVEVSGDTVKAVNPDPLRFRPDMGAVVITWHLPADYRFARNGIVIDGELDRPGGKLTSREQKEITDCKPVADGRQFQCYYRNSRPGTFKYTVRVQRQGKALAPLDPEITNML
ncbi:MAG TPA: hypothetical protein PKO45_09280 [Rubrivivax sp.]|nr:hypothetical protein [Burkholderiales bacterium]HNT39299.1 hypothetical protein [Rubrivivax sp.]